MFLLASSVIVCCFDIYNVKVSLRLYRDSVLYGLYARVGGASRVNVTGVREL